jgi:hypothetical protein
VDETLSSLAETLRERLAIVADEESRRDTARHIERLKDVSERLDGLEKKLPAATDPQLKHYIQRRSYSKALEYLDALP